MGGVEGGGNVTLFGESSGVDAGRLSLDAAGRVNHHDARQRAVDVLWLVQQAGESEGAFHNVDGQHDEW